MPFLFLSPSTQAGNPYVTEGNERLWMNRIADRMEPYPVSYTHLTLPTRSDV